MTHYPQILIQKHNGKYDWWELADQVRVRCSLAPLTGRFIIPKGYTSDFASVPQLFWWLVPPHGVTATACIVHDYLYEVKPFKHVTRREVDDYWLSLLRATTAPRWQIYLMYYYVRLLGWFTYYR